MLVSSSSKANQILEPSSASRFVQFGSMAITNDKELLKAAQEVGRLLQEIEDYCGRINQKEAKIRFPRGVLRPASFQRSRLPFVKNVHLKSNLAYTLILADVISWLLNRTDIASTAREMLIKLVIFLSGTLIESITKDYLKGLCGKGYKERTQYLLDRGVINNDLRYDLDWVWDARNNMHLFLLEKAEYENEYNLKSHIRSTEAFKTLVTVLATKGRLE